MNLCIGFFFFLFFYGLKGLVFFLADKHKTALCVSVISLPGLAAKLASAAPSVELAKRSRCHTEQPAFQKPEAGGLSMELCVGDSVVVVGFSFLIYCIPKSPDMQHCPTF